MKITYLFPSKSRKDKFFSSLANIEKNSENGNYEIIAVLDGDDTEMSNLDATQTEQYFYNFKIYYGNSTGKVDAINREINKISYDTDIVCLHSDDFVFTKFGFDNDIREAFSNGFQGLAHFPDNKIKYRPLEKHAIGFYEWIKSNYWTQDLGNGKWVRGIVNGDFNRVCETMEDLHTQYVLELNQHLVTYPIMHINYLRRFGYLYYPGYTSVFADQEQTIVAKMLGQYKYIDKIIMEHQHYRWGFGKPDALMLHNDSKEMYEKDRNTFFQRKAINFGINNVMV